MEKPTFFSTPAAFRKWLEKYHNKKKELLVGYYKIGSKKPSITWSESVDQALCFGWIDGIRRGIDSNSYCIRFTPRKPDSTWSTINIRKVKELSKKGLMREEGMAAFRNRTTDKPKVHAVQKPDEKLSPAYEKKFRSKKKAWKYFLELSPGYRKLSIQWIMGAKQETTRMKRLTTIIEQSAAGTNPWKDHTYGPK